MMESLIPLLFLLACPLGMGLAMWLVTRAGRRHPGGPGSVLPASVAGTPQLRDPRPWGPQEEWTPRRGRAVCLDWRAMVGLGIIAVLVWLLAPKFLWLALVVLALLACPLSMYLMTRGMQHNSCAPGPGGQGVRSREPLPERPPERATAELRGDV
ncbi:hypothetical protein HRbin32_00943 [bacterium HR32]|nr:hypothetical protein HRbin32_00943 [bacterium HR32]